ncbi:MAG: DUF2059 domain-containing protein [bacterium]|nr:DUF2059 domain-containing protein [bacterium]
MSVARISRLLVATAILSVVSLAGATTAAAEDEKGPSAAFRKSLRAYLEIQNTYVSYGDSIAYQAANETLMQIAASGAEVTEQMQQIVLEEAQAKFGEKLGDLDYLTKVMAPVYAKYFDEKEMEALVEFWDSPLGRKSLETSGQMNQDSMAALQEVTFGITPAFHLAIDARLRELGFETSVQPGPGAPAVPTAQ